MTDFDALDRCYRALKDLTSEQIKAIARKGVVNPHALTDNEVKVMIAYNVIHYGEDETKIYKTLRK